jgi:uncharacterized membrane protein
MKQFRFFNSVLRLPVLLLFSISFFCHGQTITTFDPNGSISTIPQAMNGAGQITGYYLDATGVYHGFLREPDGSFVSFDGLPGTCCTIPMSINRQGQIVGITYNGIDSRGFLRQTDGTVETFNGFCESPMNSKTMLVASWLSRGFNGTGNIATAINNKGEITGVLGNNTYQSFLRKPDGTFNCFATSPGTEPTNTQAWAINRAGDTTGFYLDSGYHGFLRKRNGTMNTFDPTGSTFTFPQAINRVGQIIGYYQDETGLYHGFLREPDATIIPFDISGSTMLRPTSINAAGEVIGYYLDTDTYHGFVRQTDGSITTIDVPEAGLNCAGSFAQAINRKGQITGYYEDQNCVVHGFVRNKPKKPR